METLVTTLGSAHTRWLICAIICYTNLTLGTLPAHASSCVDAQPVATLATLQGQVETRPATATTWHASQPNDELCAGDQLRVGSNSRATLSLYNDTILRLDQNTAVTLSGLDQPTDTWIDLSEGIAYFISRVKQSFQAVTPHVNAFIEGTEFLVAVDLTNPAQGKTTVSVFEGIVAARNTHGEQRLVAGQSAVAWDGQAPVLTTEVHPQDAVHWALHYPLILDYAPATFDALTKPWQTRIQASLSAAKLAQYPQAIQTLHDLPPVAGHTPLYTYRASLYLAVGRVTLAQQDLHQVLQHQPDHSAALALLSVIAIVQNDKTQAHAYAQRALQADARQPSAQLAYAYVQQAAFDVEGALTTIQQAQQQHPQNALIAARLAELYLSTGQLDAALAAAQQAVALQPDLARTQSVLGFAHLLQVHKEPAARAFQNAITLDPSDPLARLGLGLNYIRQGQLALGRHQIELATNLAPNHALIRSYLGKAYYEEKRNQLATTQFDLAKQLDPKDPTPYFYSAIQKQSENRPVEALQDLQTSMDLNDNRAVYRSKLLLDQDNAARSASLARIYSDLGFEQRALVEAWQSVNEDPANHSAHRFLSDAYAKRRRHEVARVSELLQAQLLQPVNLTPLQPQLAESSLGILSGTGPSEAGFNEFNPLFTQDGFSMQLNGIAGSNDLKGNDLVHAGLIGKIGYSLGQYHYETDGFRQNNDIKQNLRNVFLQADVTSRTSVQAEYRDYDESKGDVSLNFDPNDFSSGRRENTNTQTSRLGVRHTFNTKNRLLASIIQQDKTIVQNIPSDFVNVVNDDKLDGTLYELQYQTDIKRWRLIAGLGSFKTDNDQLVTFDFGLLPCILPTCLVSQNINIDHENIYLYSLYNLSDSIDLSFGLSADFVDEQSNSSATTINRKQFSPKFGLLWKINDNTSIRAAAFRAMKRSLVTNQTLEPTNITGFNQFFDDNSFTDSTRYGIALDRKEESTLFYGIELSSRHMDVPYVNDLQSVTDALWKETEIAGYINWKINNWSNFYSEYRFEGLKRARELPEGILNLKTSHVPIGFKFFHTNGLAAYVELNLVRQRAKLINTSVVDEPINFERDKFTLLDIGMHYRLPGKKGLLSIEVKNLLDRNFQYQEIDLASPRFSPERVTFGKFIIPW